MLVVAGPPGSGKTSYFPVTALGIDSFNIDDRCAQVLGSYRAIPREPCGSVRGHPGHVRLRLMSIDRGDFHYDDAQSWERACRHIGLFLWWAADRGLASEDHHAEEIAPNPTQYFIGQCDTKLWDEDLTDDGNAFATAAYDEYLGEVGVYAEGLGVGNYEVPEGEATRKHFFDWLDARLATWRAESS